ncbi:YcxB family protein [Segetibacter koreensis]|uniref:YcxB family protein n=1 Tax=Segetibacter koreensis TaxID=398037 RepID=UPI00037F7A95|nr:YcxB family protein [Segetibacter koreensis]
MQIFFSYDKKLVIQALRYHFINRSEVRLLMILVNLFAIFSAALFYFHKVSPLAFLLSSVLWIALMISFWFILPNTVYKKASTFKDTFKMTFGEHRVRLENERGFTEWNWEKFASYIESPHFIHLYFDSKSFFLVPKNALEKDGNLESLRRLLHEKIGKKK